MERITNVFASISPDINKKNVKCPICNVIITQHGCLYEVGNRFIYNGQSKCAKTFCLHEDLHWDMKEDNGNAKNICR